MSRMTKTMTAVSAVLILSAAATFGVRAQDSTPAPAPAPDAAAPAQAAPAPDAAAPADAAAQTPEPPRDPNTVVAKAGPVNITEGDVTLAQEAFADELANVPKEQWRSVLVDAVINMQLMAQGARDAGLDKGPDFDRRVEFLKLQALRNAFVDHEIVKTVSDADLQAAYKTMVVDTFKPEQQIHARHILVDTKEAADKIIADLKAGAKFEDLAKQSKDPSGQNGGDLGFFGPGQMVPEFEKAAFALEPGQITQEPVKTEYGYHVIKVEEKRMSQPPGFDEVKDQLKNYVMRQKFQTATATLREKYPVEIVDPTAMPPAQAPAPTGDDTSAPSDEVTPDDAAPMDAAPSTDDTAPATDDMTPAPDATPAPAPAPSP
jgi:peptidyl-prolyl cis-trans isomerase C